MAGFSWMFWVALGMMIVGLLGVFLPLLPGTGFMWVVVLVYAIMERFKTIDPLSLAILTMLGLGGATADLWMGLLGARVGGASPRATVYSLLGSLVGGLVGLVFAGLGAFPGMIIGAVGGVLLSEYRARRSWKAAWQATVGLVIGFTLSTVAKAIIGLLMLAIFVWQALRG